MHFFFLRETWRSILQHRGLASTAILSLTATLTLSGIFLLLTHNAEFALKLIGDRREMIVYLRDDINETDREELTKRLRSLYGSVTYISKDEAWEEFQEQIGNAELLEAVGENPLPASFRVRLKAELLNYPAMEKAAGQVREFPEVEDVRYGAAWVQRLDQLTTALRRGSLGVGIIVGLAILFVVYNTLRLSVLARREQVQVMTRLGATDQFIATPFVLEAVLQAAVAAIISLGVVFGLQQGLASQVWDVVFLPVEWIVVFVGATVALAWFAAMFALARVLRTVGR
jgi:cell division transport system permease protein